MRPFAVSAGDRKDIKKKESRTLEWITLGYQGAGEARLAKYEELVWPDQFVKGSEYGILNIEFLKQFIFERDISKVNCFFVIFSYVPLYSLIHILMI